jgi:hypothetical protein
MVEARAGRSMLVVLAPAPVMGNGEITGNRRQAIGPIGGVIDCHQSVGARSQRILLCSFPLVLASVMEYVEWKLLRQPSHDLEIIRRPGGRR